jgi:hypothetical protein
MRYPKVSSFFRTVKEVEKINHRKPLLQIVVDKEVSNPPLVELANDNVWGWFRMGLRNKVFLESGLSDEDRIHLMRLCEKEKVKCQNMGEKGVKNFITVRVSDLKSKKRNSTPHNGGGGVAVEGAVGL